MTSKMPKEDSGRNGCVRWRENVGEIGEDGWNIDGHLGVSSLQGEVEAVGMQGRG